jgi:hypothetical protein
MGDLTERIRKARNRAAASDGRKAAFTGVVALVCVIGGVLSIIEYRAGGDPSYIAAIIAAFITAIIAATIGRLKLRSHMEIIEVLWTQDNRELTNANKF